MIINIVACEFPPSIGGMQQHAFGLATALAENHTITVYTHEWHRRHYYQANFKVRAILKGDLAYDREKLREERAEAWVTLNAGYAPLALYVDAPTFAYCHGNDFLRPWINVLNTEQHRYLSGMRRRRLLRRFEPRLKKFMHRRVIGKGLSAAQLIFVNSEFTRTVLSKIYPRFKARIIVNHPGVADYFFEQTPQPRNLPPPSHLQLLTIARLSTQARKKNIDNILRALAQVKDEIDFSLQIAGDGDMKSDLEQLARNLGLDQQTNFLGKVSNERLISYLDQADLLVLPSRAQRGDVESFGIVYVEAAARGVPSLLSRAGGATDAVSDGTSGIIIDGAEPEDIVMGLRKFYNTRHKLNRADIVRFSHNFRWSHVAAELTKAITGALIKLD